MKQGFLIASFLLISGLCGGTVRGEAGAPLPAESYSARRAALDPLFEKDSASAEAILRARAGDQTEIEVVVKGLKPDEVSTIWAVHEHQLSVITAMDSEDNAIQTDASGKGHSASFLLEANSQS